VQLDQIPVDQLPLARDPVDHLVIHRNADVLGKSVEILERAARSAPLRLALRRLVQLLERDPRLDELLQLLQYLEHDDSRLAHDGDLVGGLQLDVHYGFAGSFAMPRAEAIRPSTSSGV